MRRRRGSIWKPVTGENCPTQDEPESHKSGTGHTAGECPTAPGCLAACRRAWMFPRPPWAGRAVSPWLWQRRVLPWSVLRSGPARPRQTIRTARSSPWSAGPACRRTRSPPNSLTSRRSPGSSVPNISSMRRSSGLWRDEMRDSMNWSIGNRRFWLNSRIASFWLARSCERVETRR